MVTSSTKHLNCVFWLYGLSAAGKSTIVNATANCLRGNNHPVLVLDGDELRLGLCHDLGFSVQDRLENVRRAAEIAKLACAQGFFVLSALMTPHEEMRRVAGEIIGKDRFREVYVKCNLETCIRRDPKELYARAKAGTITHMLGKDLDFEEPVMPYIILDTENGTVQSCVDQLLRKIRLEQ